LARPVAQEQATGKLDGIGGAQHVSPQQRSRGCRYVGQQSRRRGPRGARRTSSGRPRVQQSERL